ncbi:hypothetical protein D3C81_1635540 [compost metagenome]
MQVEQETLRPLFAVLATVAIAIVEVVIAQGQFALGIFEKSLGHQRWRQTRQQSCGHNAASREQSTHGVFLSPALSVLWAVAKVPESGWVSMLLACEAGLSGALRRTLTARQRVHNVMREAHQAMRKLVFRGRAPLQNQGNRHRESQATRGFQSHHGHRFDHRRRHSHGAIPIGRKPLADTVGRSIGLRLVPA